MPIKIWFRKTFNLVTLEYFNDEYTKLLQELNKGMQEKDEEIKNLQSLVDAKQQEVYTLREWIESLRLEKTTLLKRLGIILPDRDTTQPTRKFEPVRQGSNWSDTKNKLESISHKMKINREGISKQDVEEEQKKVDALREEKGVTLNVS